MSFTELNSNGNVIPFPTRRLRQSLISLWAGDAEAMRGLTTRSTLAAAIAVSLMALATFSWLPALVVPKGALNNAEAFDGAPRISPFEIMIRRGNDLPADSWKDLF
jgi:hypothetical protein